MSACPSPVRSPASTYEKLAAKPETGASALEIGVRTIETHRERIMRKLNIRSVAGLTRFSIANGLVSLDGAYKH